MLPQQFCIENVKNRFTNKKLWAILFIVYMFFSGTFINKVLWEVIEFNIEVECYFLQFGTYFTYFTSGRRPLKLEFFT